MLDFVQLACRIFIQVCVSTNSFVKFTLCVYYIHL